MIAAPPAAVGAARSTDSYLPRHGNGGYQVGHYDLTLEYRARSGRLRGRAVITAVATQRLGGFSLDLGALRVERVLVGGTPVRYRHAEGKLTVSPTAVLPAEAPFVVEVGYTGVPAGIP
ncbi:MAG TPA: M1 family peptidase, partial [Pilimelia sp.]|nr:M1 family peptidase [Pilimelia sp.]